MNLSQSLFSMLQPFSRRLLSFSNMKFCRITEIMIAYYIIIKWWARAFKTLYFNPFSLGASLTFIELRRMKNLLTMHNWSSHGWITKVEKKRKMKMFFICFSFWSPINYAKAERTKLHDEALKLQSQSIMQSK